MLPVLLPGGGWQRRRSAKNVSNLAQSALEPREHGPKPRLPPDLCLDLPVRGVERPLQFAQPLPAERRAQSETKN